MTGLLHEKEFSRRSFVKRGGALIVGFSALGAAAGKASGAGSTNPAHAGFVPGPLDPSQVDTWIAVNADNTVTVYGEKLELGQGTTTGLRQIAAEELGVAIDQIVWPRADTNVTPNQGGTVGSSGIRSGGPQIRAGAAYAAQALLGLASANLGVPAASLSVGNGVVSGGGGRQVSYADLLGGRLFNVTMPTLTLQPGVAPAKPPSAYTLVTTRVPRIDIPAKVTGTWTYMQNVHLPGMLHGRIVRPRGQGPYGAGAPVVAIDPSSIARIPNVQIVHVGDFVGVVAPVEYDAIQAAALLKVTWKDDPILPGTGNLFGAMLTQPTTDAVKVNTGSVTNGFIQAAKTVNASYAVDYQMHGSIGPTCALADVTKTGALVLCSAQDIYELRPLLAQCLGMSEPQVRVQFYDSSGCFGHNTQYDSAQAAAIMSQQVGAPVRVQFMRWDEHGWDQYGPAALLVLRGGIDGGGNIIGYDYISYEPPNVDLETSQELIGTPLDQIGPAGADANNSAGMYALPNRRVTGKSLPVLQGYLKTAPLRAPGAPQATFASEQLIDELAHAAGADPIAFRLQNLTDQRWITVIQAAAQAAGWQSRPAAAQVGSGTVVNGRGIGIGTAGGGTRAAVIAEIQVNKQSGKITVNHIFTAQDAGLAVNPALIENQMMGAAVQGTSRAIVEQVVFSRSRVTSLDWVTYPILRFRDSPLVTTVVVQRTDQPATGSGEPPTVGAPAAIANAFFDATGVRIRQMPMTAGRVRATLKAAGVA